MEKGHELISIIVPIYNVEQYLDKCIESIMNQTYTNLEIILVDDGSTDSCGDICDKYAKLDNRIKVIHKKNGGLSDARNEGIKIAKGNYIGFVDSDDFIRNTMYEYLFNLIYEYDADISVCNYSYLYENGNINDDNVEEKEENIKIMNTEDGLRELLKGEIIQDFAWNKLYKSSLFDDVQYPVGRKMEDIGTTYRLFNLSKKIVLGNKREYFYLQRESSIMGKKNPSLYIDLYILSIERYDFIEEKYPDMQENYIDILNKILAIYKVDNVEVEQFFINEKLFEKYKKILKKVTKSGLSPKLKIKFLLFKHNKTLYRFFVHIIK